MAFLYSGVVLLHTVQSYDLRIYPLFTHEEDGESETFRGAEIARVADDMEATPTIPRAASGKLRADRVIRLPAAVTGGQFRQVHVPSFPHFVRLSALLKPSITAIPAEGMLPENTDLVAADIQAEQPLPPVVEVDGPQKSRWAKLELARFNEELGERGAWEVKETWLKLKPVPYSSILISVAWFLFKFIIFVIGAVVLWKRPSDRAAQMFFVLCAISVVAFMGGFHWSSLLGSRWLLYPFILCAMLLAPVTLHFYLLFPQPHIVIRNHPKKVLWGIYGLPSLLVLVLFGCLIWVNRLYEQQPLIANDELLVREISQGMTWLGRLVYVSLGVAALWFVVSLSVLVHRYVTTTVRAERNQVKWILFAAVPASLPIGYVLYTATSNPAEFAYGTTTKPLMLGASLMFTLAYAVSISRYRLMQAGRFISRSLLYFAISFAAMALFCLMVGVWVFLSGSGNEFPWEYVFVVGLTAMLVLMTMGLVGTRMHRSSELRLHHEKLQLDKAMRRLGRAVDQLVEPAQLVQHMLHSAMDAVSAQAGAVYLLSSQEDLFERIAHTGLPSAPAVLESQGVFVEELQAQGTVIPWLGAGLPPTAAAWRLRDFGGQLAIALQGPKHMSGLVLLGSKEDGTSYTFEERNLLLALARTTALALESAQGYKMIEQLRGDLQAKVNQIAEQQQRILFLQSELLDRRTPAGNAASKEETSSDQLFRHSIRGTSPALQETLSKVSKIARSTSSVLIRGESGTGKELLANAIHENSTRAAGPFVRVHCAALSQGLLESEMFGHVKGAFTGADRDKIGRFEMADCGTLFLDEIGDINLETQTKLLRVLQEQTFERVGGTDTIRVDVRVIAATHRHLENLIRQGKFREDLYYRLNVISLTMPPLRERSQDVLELAMHFLRVYAQQVGKPLARIEKSAMDALLAYPWPGNVRQLENALERGVVLAEGDSLTLHDLPPEILSYRPSREESRASPRTPRTLLYPPPASAIAPSGLNDELHQQERERLQSVLSECNGNKARAARLLGLPRSTLFSKLRKHGLS